VTAYPCHAHDVDTLRTQLRSQWEVQTTKGPLHSQYYTEGYCIKFWILLVRCTQAIGNSKESQEQVLPVVYKGGGRGA
jgi:hypothetical protein